MAPNPACTSFVALLSAYIDGELPPDQRMTVERHLGACAHCTMRTADLRAESGLLRVGLEMLADEVDFTGFAQKVMARVTPERPPFWERVRLSLSETLTYQRGMLVTAVAVAAMLALVVPVMLRQAQPTGYAAERMAVETVKTDENVAPIRFVTASGNNIIWLTDHKAEELDDEAQTEELEKEPEAPTQKRSPPVPVKPEKPNGGEL